MTNDAPIFVVGTSRSGTSLLRAMLNAHPNIYLTQEAAFYRWSQPDRLAGCATVGQWLDGYTRSISFRLLQIPPDAIRARVDPERPRSELKAVFTAIMRYKAERFRRTRWGDKTPLNSIHLDRIFADYPDARVVYVSRRPEATVASLRRMPWGCDSILLSSLFYRSVAARISPSPRLLLVRLEELLSEPEPTLRRVLAHVGEPWSADVLDHAAHAPTEGEPLFPWFRRSFQPLSPSSAAKQPLSAAERWWVHLITRDARHALGHAPSVPAQASVLALAGVWGLDVLRAVRFGARLLWNRPRTDRPEQIDAQEQLRWLLGLNPSAHVPPSARTVSLPPNA